MRIANCFVVGSIVAFVAQGCSLTELDPINYGSAGSGGTSDENDDGGSAGSGDTADNGGSASKGGSTHKNNTETAGTNSTDNESGGSAGRSTSSNVPSQGGTASGGASATTGGASATTGGTSTATVSVTAVPTATPDLVGFKSSVSAAASSSSNGSALTYDWTVLSVPTGSTITTPSLSNAKAVAPSFLPDLGGTYQLQLTVSNGTVTDTKTVSLTVPSFDIGYLRVAGDNSSYTRSGAMIRSDGTNDRLVGCPYTDSATSESDWIGGFQTEGQFFFQAYYPTDISRDVELYYAHEDTNTGSVAGQIAGPSSTCGTSTNTVGGLFPVFSPNGQRLLTLTPITVDGGATYTYDLTSVASNGTDQRTIRHGVNTSGTPSWADDTHVVWSEYDAEAAGTSYVVVYKATDRTGSFSDNLEHETLMTCKSANNPLSRGISQVVLKNDILYLTGIDTGSPTTPSTDVLWRLKPVQGEYLCDTTATSNNILFADFPRSFELSPDGSQVLFFVSTTAGTSEVKTTAIMVSSTTPGSTPTTLVPHDGATNVGVRWVAGGRQVIWSKTVIRNSTTTSGTGGSTSTDERPVSSGLWIINTDGTNPRQLHTFFSVSTQARAIHTGSLEGIMICGIGRVGSSHGAHWVALTILFGLAGFGRRRSDTRRKSNTLSRQ